MPPPYQLWTCSYYSILYTMSSLVAISTHPPPPISIVDLLLVQYFIYNEIVIGCFITDLINMPPPYQLWTCSYYSILYTMSSLLAISSPPPISIVDLLLVQSFIYNEFFIGRFTHTHPISIVDWLLLLYFIYNEFIIGHYPPTPPPPISIVDLLLLQYFIYNQFIIGHFTHTHTPPNINCGPAPTTVFYIQWVHY